jgi:hypothetical protein
MLVVTIRAAIKGVLAAAEEGQRSLPRIVPPEAS